MKIALIRAAGVEGAEMVYSIPALRRLVLLTRITGFDHIVVLSSDSRLRPLVADFTGDPGFTYTEEPADCLRRLVRLSSSEDPSVLLLDGRHVIDRWSLGRMVESKPGKEGAVMEKKGAEGGAPILFVRLSSLLPLLSIGREWQEILEELGSHGSCVKGAEGLPEFLNGQADRIRAAEAALSAATGEATWDRDSLLYRHASRHISRLISPWISRTPITANAVTLFCTAIGLFGAFLLFRGGYLNQAAGSLLFLLSTIVDLVDGEVARLKLEESEFGHYLDITCDNIVHLAVFAGTSLGLYRSTGNIFFVELLGLLIAGFFICACILNRTLAESRAGMRPPEQNVFLEALFNNRDFAYLMALLALIGRLDWFLVASTIGAYVLALVLWVLKIRRRPARGEDVA